MMRNLYLKVLFLFLLIICGGEDSHAKNEISKLTNLDGLSNNSVNCIFQDWKGIMWFGTWDGLNSYDGHEFKSYHYSNSEHSISNNVVRQILETDSTHLWIATDYGINRWNRNSDSFDSYFLDKENLYPKQERSYMMALTQNLDLICYINHQGLFYFDRLSGSFALISDFSDNDVKNFVIDRNDNIFFLLVDGSIKQYTINRQENKILLTYIKSIMDVKPILNVFSTAEFLILQYADYIKVFDRKNQYPSAVDIDKGKRISQILYRNECFWISYIEGGCDIYNFRTKEYQPLADFPENTSILSIFSGTQDILWIGTDGHGVWRMYNYSPPFKAVYTNYPVRAFNEISQSEILIGMKGGGLKRYNKKDQSLRDLADPENQLISNSIYAIAKNSAGDIFIGTEGAGVNVLSGSRLYKLGLPSNAPFFRAVYSIIFTDNDSTMWLGTSGFGLIKLGLEKNQDTWTAKYVVQYSSSNNSDVRNSDIIYSIVESDIPNNLWIATRRGGLFNFDMLNNQFRSLSRVVSDSVKLTDNDVLSLSKDSSFLFVGTSFGLNVLKRIGTKRVSVNTYTMDQGLANNVIHGVLSNNSQDIWVSTNNGLSNVNFVTSTVNNYSINDGLQNNEFSDGAYFKDSDGIFYFGGVGGFNYFSPSQISLRDFEAKLLLSGLKIFNTTLNLHDKIKDNTLYLADGEAYVSLSFLSLDYINSQNCEYAYRLINFSDEWISNGNNRNIVLTNLPPGKYELQVKATNGDGVWSNNVYTLRIDVAYPWWLSLPAIIIYIILALVVSYIIYIVVLNRIRLNRRLLLERIEKENQNKIHESKLNFFTNVAHEFFTPLTLISGPAQYLLDKSDMDRATRRYIQIIKNNSDRMQKLISELMDFRKAESGSVSLYPEEIDVEVLIGYITDNYLEISEQTNIKFDVDLQSVGTIVTDRNSIEKILFNLISNAFKYTPANGFESFARYLIRF